MVEREKPGPKKNSSGARRIAEAHRGKHDHDKSGGFAANPRLAKEAGKKGGNSMKAKYGPKFFSEIGKKGGAKVKAERGKEFFAANGRKGAEARKRNREKQAESAKMA